jgi:hypothetical protein
VRADVGPGEGVVRAATAVPWGVPSRVPSLVRVVSGGNAPAGPGDPDPVPGSFVPDLVAVLVPVV